MEGFENQVRSGRSEKMKDGASDYHLLCIIQTVQFKLNGPFAFDLTFFMYMKIFAILPQLSRKVFEIFLQLFTSSVRTNFSRQRIFLCRYFCGFQNDVSIKSESISLLFNKERGFTDNRFGYEDRPVFQFDFL